MFLEFSHFRKPWHGNLHRADVCVWICVDFCHKDVTCTVVQAAQMSGNIGPGVSARKLISQFLYVVCRDKDVTCSVASKVKHQGSSTWG